MIWSGDKVNDYFIALYSQCNPERLEGQRDFSSLYDTQLALKDFYRACCGDAWTKERLTKCLERIIYGGIIENKKAKDIDLYSEIYLKAAKDLLNEIQAGTFNYSR